MSHLAELEFFKKILDNFQLPYHVISYPFDDIPDLDLGLRKLLDPTTKFDEYLKFELNEFPPNVIHHITDKFGCSYLSLCIPDQVSPSYFFIGPYLQTPFSTSDAYTYVERYNIPPELVSQIQNYFYSLPLVPEHNILFSIVNAFCEKLYGSVENYSVKVIEQAGVSASDFESMISTYQNSDMPIFSSKLIEERYTRENSLMLAVSQGNFVKAEQLLKPYGFANLPSRTAEPMRNEKNYSVILNTLLRKAAEHGSVHPYHIDILSSKMARKIELCTSIKEIDLLHKEMVHKYCLLVKNHSMRNYSLLIRKVLTQIDADLTANLSLHTIASNLNVNSSYLSTLFKKEVGCTLTEYVNRKRIEHAILLLNSTSMQIQNIAQHSGITDVNYFTKLFKKQMGMTPKEYRESLYP